MSLGENGTLSDMNEIDLSSTTSRDAPWLLEGDYREALIHLAWVVEQRNRYVVFGMVELFPSELPSPDETAEEEWDYRDNGVTHRVYVKRCRLSLDQALLWYADCRAGTIILPGDRQRDGSAKVLVTSPLFADPPWPQVVSATSLPFVSPTWGTVRIHHLLPTDTLPILARLLRPEHADVMRWFSDHLLFDLVTYHEWIGSVHLVAPNPVFRELERRPGALGSDGTESTFARLVARAGQTLDGLQLIMTEYGPTGITETRSIDVTRPDLHVPHIGTVTSVDHRIVCPRRGVLDWSGPMEYGGGILINVHASVTRRVVDVPGPQGRTVESYAQQLIDSTTQTKIEGPRRTASPMREIHRLRQLHLARRANQQRIEMWFRDNQDEATRLVRGLLSSARSRVWIIDPYFSTVELFSFAMAVTVRDIPVTIVTSAVHLKEKDRVLSKAKAGEVLRRQIGHLEQHQRFHVLVMTGNPPLVHDRFLVIDDTVWFSGNSLHTLGKRAGMIVKLAQPERVIAELERIIDDERVVSLDRWIETRRNEDWIQRLLARADRRVRAYMKRVLPNKWRGRPLRILLNRNRRRMGKSRSTRGSPNGTASVKGASPAEESRNRGEHR